MKILIIGSGGQLATDLIKVLKDEEFIKADLPDFDITKHEQVARFLADCKSEVVINCAAYHQVDDCEDNDVKCFAVNSIAVKNLAALSRKMGFKLLHCSTDYVFGGNAARNVPYVETDKTDPINAYGISKLAGEKYVQYEAEKYFICRLSGLFGVAGSAGKGGNFVETMIRLGKERGEVKVVDDQVLTPTYTMDIARNMAQLIKTDNFGLYHMTSEGQCSWYEFAKKIFELMKMDVKCSPCTSAEFPTRAKRPSFSVLENEALKKIGLNKMRQWDEALRDYLKEKGYL